MNTDNLSKSLMPCVNTREGMTQYNTCTSTDTCTSTCSKTNTTTTLGTYHRQTGWGYFTFVCQNVCGDDLRPPRPLKRWLGSCKLVDLAHARRGELSNQGIGTDDLLAVILMR